MLDPPDQIPAARRFQFTGRIRSFYHAMRGIVHMVRCQHNAWIHAAATLVVLSAGFLLRISPSDWCWIVLAIAIVWTAEALNTAFVVSGRRSLAGVSPARSRRQGCSGWRCSSDCCLRRGHRGDRLLAPYRKVFSVSYRRSNQTTKLVIETVSAPNKSSSCRDESLIAFLQSASSVPPPATGGALDPNTHLVGIHGVAIRVQGEKAGESGIP